jgi:hypothetical protein
MISLPCELSETGDIDEEEVNSIEICDARMMQMRNPCAYSAEYSEKIASQ